MTWVAYFMPGFYLNVHNYPCPYTDVASKRGSKLQIYYIFLLLVPRLSQIPRTGFLSSYTDCLQELTGAMCISVFIIGGIKLIYLICPPISDTFVFAYIVFMWHTILLFYRPRILTNIMGICCCANPRTFLSTGKLYTHSLLSWP